MFDYIVVGAGYAGSVTARRMAEEAGKTVLLIDKRNHIAGNMYDEYDENGILVHRYGPHISVMNETRVYEFLSRFTEWQPYHHHVKAEIDGVEVPLPINYTAIDLLFPIKQALDLKERLTKQYGFGSNVPVLEMLENTDEVVREFAQYVFDKVFLHYTMKMWGLRPEEINPAVTGRIPIRLSYDDRHFLHTYQVMPKDGFTKLFQNMLNHPNITVRLNTSSDDVLRLDEKNHQIYFENKLFEGTLVYTGALDELFGFDYGALPYRSLFFKFETFNKDYVQDSTVLNWPDDRPATRRTEMKRLTGQRKEGITSTIVEYPDAFDRCSDKFSEPLYPIDREDCIKLYRRYLERTKTFPKLILAGRLADYKYYNMEAVISRSLAVTDLLLR